MAALLAAAAEDVGKVQYVATVKVPEAEVRSGAGASAELYATNRLHKGDKVEVVKELQGGWLAIKPPPGSFSWINSRFVKEAPPGKPMWVVVAHPEVRVPLLMGSDVHADKPTVEGVRVVYGTLLRSVGPCALPTTAAGCRLSRRLPRSATFEPRPSRAPALKPIPRRRRPPPSPRGSRAAWRPNRCNLFRCLRQRRPSPCRRAGSPAVPATWSRPAAASTIRRTYLLLNSQGQPIVYVTAAPGYSLEPYVQRNVELYGVRRPRQDIRADHMTAMQVKLLP